MSGRILQSVPISAVGGNSLLIKSVLLDSLRKFAGVVIVFVDPLVRISITVAYLQEIIQVCVRYI